VAALRQWAAFMSQTQENRPMPTPGADQIRATVDQVTAAGNQAFKDAADKSLAALNEINSHSKRNLEALVASVTAATKGAEALGAQAMAFTKKSVEDQAAAAKALTGARSVQEVVELQTSFAKSAIEAYIAELNRASETVSAAVKDSIKPLNERATALVEAVQSKR
jgi:phasin family protein